MTEAERRAWKLLRERQVDGFKFRCQVLLGPCIADFENMEAVDRRDRRWSARWRARCAS
ncbi:DUF559 domain-containing protein [Dokdonella soli]|uniref:DUF559 domain-containing protein n=1 Tax=Dokdonella soli TaxID=529810 RepID=UPI003621CB61